MSPVGRRAHLARRVLSVAVVAVVVAGITATALPRAGASPDSGGITVYTCDVTPLDQLVTFTYPNNTAQEECGVEWLENEAYEMYAAETNIPPGDPRLMTNQAQATIAGILWQLFLNLAASKYYGSATPLPQDATYAYDWMFGLVDAYNTAAAQDAINEYNKWANEPCSYEPPNTTLFSFDPYADPACSGTEASLFAGPSPPSYSNFISYGSYDAQQGLDLGQNLGGSYDNLDQELMAEGSGSTSALLLLIPALMQQIAPETLAPVLNFLRPYSETRVYRVFEKMREAQQKQQQASEDAEAEEDDTLGGEEGEAGGEEAITLDGDEASFEIQEMFEAGLDEVGAVAELGAAALTGPFIIITLAAIILAQEAQIVATEDAIPGQLQANLASVPTSLYQVVSNSSGAGYQLAYGLFEGSLHLPGPTTGTPGNVDSSAPSDGTQWQVTYTAQDGQSDTEYQPTVDLATWPLGVAQGLLGGPFANFALDDGQVWSTATPDQSEDGLDGYMPSNLIHYFNWSGQPMLAYVDGDQFIEMPDTGSVDMGGSDAGNGCEPGGCQISSTLDALQPGDGDIQPTLLDTDSVTGTTTVTQQSDGDLVGRFIGSPVQLSIEHDPGQAPAITIVNQYGHLANATTGGEPNGGDFAGQTVTLLNWGSNPLGYSETDTWQIESRCSYGQVCTDDPDFGDEPVTTLSGETVHYTWPTEGTYVVKLTTVDQYGTTRSAEETVTVGGTAPTFPFSTTPGFSSPAVIGPISNGGTVYISGCITTDDGFYAQPTATIDWGDGSDEDTASLSESSSSDISITYDPSVCTSGFELDASHNYEITSTGAPVVQFPVSITVTDGFGESTTVSPYVQMDFTSKPSFTTAASTVFTPGALGYFTVSTTGVPAPTLTGSGSLPSGLGLDVRDNGTAVITGTPSAADDGTYPLVFSATNSQGTVDQDFTLDIDSSPIVTSPTSGQLTVGVNGTIDLAVSGYPAPTFTVLGTLPSGVALSGGDGGTGTLSGTPAAGSAGTYDLMIVASNSLGTVEQPYTLVVGTAPGFTSSSTADFVTNGPPSSFAITTSGSPAPTISLSGTLPTGLGFAATGNGTAELYGSPESSGTWDVVLTATSSSGQATEDLTVNSSPAGGPVISFSGSSWSSGEDEAVFQQGEGGSLSVSSSDTSSDLSIVGTLPDGLSFADGADGTATISGTPGAGSSGSYGLEVTVAGGGYAFLDIVVTGDPVITSSTTATFTAGESSSFTVSTGALPTAALSTSASLPSGLSFTDNGDGTATISGTPSVGDAGTYSIPIAAENIVGTTNATLTLEIDVSPSISSNDSTTFAEGAADSFTVTTAGYPDASLSEVGPLPAGVSFTDNDNGTATIAGTPSDDTVESFPVTITADSVAGTATQQFVLNLGPLAQFTSAPSASFTTGQAGSFTVATAGLPTPSLAATGLPDGLSLVDNGDGTATISGTATTADAGANTVTVTATNSYGSVTQDLVIDVDSAPVFGGLVYDTCADATDVTSFQFIAGNLNSDTVCATGYPDASMSLSGNLPEGVTFTDNGDGTATLSGSASYGSGGDYPLTLTMTNSAGSTTEDLDLSVVEQPIALSAPDDPDFVAGQANSYTLTSLGTPTPSFSLATSGLTAPGWVTLTDNGDGTATLSGVPPADAVGEQYVFGVWEANGVGNGMTLDIVSLTVNGVGFSAASPPATATVGTAYSYDFGSEPSGATFTVETASGSGSLPPGLTLSSDGLLSGTPTTVGSWEFSVEASLDGSTASSSPFTITVSPEPHELEITSFRTDGPLGLGDWFVEFENTGATPVSLHGWTLATQLEGSAGYSAIPLGNKTLKPHETAVVEGPDMSLERGGVVAHSSFILGETTGFELLSPPTPADTSGVSIDAAGVTGSPSALLEGSGVPVPTATQLNEEGAFFRTGAPGSPLDTGDNASDFSFELPRNRTEMLAQFIDFTSAPPSSPVVGSSSYTVSVTGGASGNPVVLSIGQSQACTLAGSVVSFVAPGTCTISATQAGAAGYFKAHTAVQKIVVGKIPQVIQFLSSAPTDATVKGPSYDVVAIGGGSENPVKLSTQGSGTICRLSGTTVSFRAAGTCTITATQAAAGYYKAATPVVQSFTVSG